MLFERYFSTAPGTFIEVGAYDGVTFSNTIGLVRRGWKGLLVEPDPALFHTCKNNLIDYPKCEVINVAISAKEMKAKLYRQGPLSTLSHQLHEKYQTLDWASIESDRGETEVTCITLDSLLHYHEIKPNFDLLVVDVEGHETQVFEGFALEFWKPQMIILELADLHPDFPELESICIQLKMKIESQNYKIVFKDHINTIFVSENKQIERMQHV